MLALVLDPATLACDLALGAGGLEGDDGLTTAVLVSLFTDARAGADDRLPDPATANPRGWWGDALAWIDSDRIGSRLWLLSREKQVRETLRRAEEYAREALAWMLTDGAARTVAVSARWVGVGVLILDITITAPAGGLPQRLSVPVNGGRQ